MEDTQHYESAGIYSVYQKGMSDVSRSSSDPDEPYTSSTIANMDEYDYMNLLAESRIVDIAWLQMR